MLYYDRIDLNEGMDPAKSNNSKECVIFHNWLFNHGLEFQDCICNGYHDYIIFPDNIYLIEISNRNPRTSFEVCLKLAIKNPKKNVIVL